jgi:hypothetical protein
VSTIIASLIAKIGADTTGIEKGVKKTKEELEKAATYARKYGASSAEISRQNAAMLGTMAGVAIGVSTALKAVVDDQIAYANSVRELATVGQTSTEKASRFIQVLDDYKISAAEATLASKALKEKGMVPTIETLAKLSDAYLAIKDPAEKMKFVQDNLGRGGTKWVEVLNKGSAALLKQNDAVAKNLILTQKMVDDARKAEIATDQWNDAVTGLKTSLAVELLPALTGVLNHYNDIVTSLQEQGYWYTLLHQFNLQDVADRREQATALMLSTGSIGENSTALADNADAIEAAKSALKDYEDQLEASSQANLDMESMSRDIAQSQKQYAEDHAAAAEILGKAITEGDAEGIAQAKRDIQDLEATWHESANNMIYDMVLVGVSAGGLLDSEQKALDEYAVKSGIKTQADIDEANRRRDIADATIEGILQSEDVLTEQRKVDAETLRLTDATTADAKLQSAATEAQAIANLTISTEGEINAQMRLRDAARETAAAYSSIPAIGGGSAKYTAPAKNTSTQTSLQKKTGSGRDSGGVGIAGQTYLIGVGAQPEAFVPDTNGTFVPNADKKLGGTTYNVVINNPVPEKSENSVRNFLKSYSYTGAPE